MSNHIIDQLRSKRGFTIIEIMIAVALIAILAAIAIPSYVGIQKKSARSEAKANLEAISVALEGYMAETNSYGPASIYPYVGTTFNHPGNIQRTANLGNAGLLLYRYRVSTTQVPVPAFSIFATPVTGLRLEGDFRLILTSNGDKWMELDNNGVYNPPGDPGW
jgi:prepilin-type N-terminal cleavage/methylation domain-containing protein